MVKQILWFALFLPCVLVYAGGDSLVGMTFELRKPLFIYYSPLFQEYIIEAPGLSTRVPETVDLFERYGENWRRHDKRLLSRHRNVVQKDLMEVVWPGTYLSIESMKIEPAVMFDVWVASGRIDDPRFTDITVRLAGLLWDTSTDEPRIDTEYLIPVAEDCGQFE